MRGVTRRVDRREAYEESLREFRPQLIFSDNSLPGFDGSSALRTAAQVCPDVPFIFVSGTMGEEAAIEALKKGATDYVLKDSINRIGPVVGRALREVQDRL